MRSSGLRPVVIFDFRQRDRHVLFAIGEHIVQDFRRLLDFGEPIEGEGVDARRDQFDQLRLRERDDVLAIDGEAGQGLRSASPITKTREVLKMRSSEPVVLKNLLFVTVAVA